MNVGRGYWNGAGAVTRRADGNRIGLFISFAGALRSEAKVGLANTACNPGRPIIHA